MQKLGRKPKVKYLKLKTGFTPTFIQDNAKKAIEKQFNIEYIQPSKSDKAISIAPSPQISPTAWGIYAECDIEPGEEICTYLGESLTRKKADQLEDKQYLLRLESKSSKVKTKFIDVKFKANFVRFINSSSHLESTNAAFQEETGVVIATRRIKKGEQIILNYGTNTCDLGPLNRSDFPWEMSQLEKSYVNYYGDELSGIDNENSANNLFIQSLFGDVAQSEKRCYRLPSLIESMLEDDFSNFQKLLKLKCNNAHEVPLCQLPILEYVKNENESEGEYTLLPSCRHTYVNALVVAICLGKTSYIESLLKAGVDPDYINKDGKSPLYYLLSSTTLDEDKKLAILDLLLEYDVCLEYRYLDQSIFAICQKNNLKECFNKLLNRCSDNAFKNLFIADNVAPPHTSKLTYAIDQHNPLIESIRCVREKSDSLEANFFVAGIRKKLKKTLYEKEFNVLCREISDMDKKIVSKENKFANKKNGVKNSNPEKLPLKKYEIFKIDGSYRKQEVIFEPEKKMDGISDATENLKGKRGINNEETICKKIKKQKITASQESEEENISDDLSDLKIKTRATEKTKGKNAKKRENGKKTKKIKVEDVYDFPDNLKNKPSFNFKKRKKRDGFFPYNEKKCKKNKKSSKILDLPPNSEPRKASGNRNSFFSSTTEPERIALLYRRKEYILHKKNT